MAHKYLIDRSWLTVYWKGSFCLLEIDVPGKTFQFCTKKGFFNTFPSEM